MPCKVEQSTPSDKKSDNIASIHPEINTCTCMTDHLIWHFLLAKALPRYKHDTQKSYMFTMKSQVHFDTHSDQALHPTSVQTVKLVHKFITVLF